MVNGVRVKRLVVVVRAGRRRKAKVAIGSELVWVLVLSCGWRSDCGVCVSLSMS
jgi:hypothetical protein